IRGLRDGVQQANARTQTVRAGWGDAGRARREGQTEGIMSDETIGGIAVGITGDYSDLADALDKAQQMAVDAGGKMAAALTEAFATASFTIPEGSISVGGAAASIAQEIARAFAETPITLNL